MRGGLELVVKVVHVVEPVGGMQGRMLREGVTSAEEITAGSPVAGCPATSAPTATATAATSTAACSATATGGCTADRRRAAGQSETINPSVNLCFNLTRFILSCRL